MTFEISVRRGWLISRFLFGRLQQKKKTCTTQIQIIMTFEPMKYHQRPRSSWLSLLQILNIDLLTYTSLFSMFADLAIFFILT